MMKKFKYLFITLVAILSVGVTGVKAEEYNEDFQKLTTDGTITIGSSTLDSNTNLVEIYINDFNNSNATLFEISTCNDTKSICTITDLYTSEQHDINIIYEDEYSEGFKSFTTTGNITVPVYDITLDKSASVNNYASTFIDDFNSFSTGLCSDDYSKCTIIYNGADGKYESHIVNVTYVEAYTEKFKQLTSTDSLVVPAYIYDDNNSNLSNYLNKLNEQNNMFNIYQWNEDYTTCIIGLYHEDTGFDERHTVNITYVETYTDEFKKLTTDGKITVPTKNSDNKGEAISEYLNSFTTDTYSFNAYTCDESYSTCVIEVVNTMMGGIYEKHEVEIAFKETYSDYFKSILTDGNLIVNQTTRLNPKTMLINSYLSNLNTNEYNFQLYYCNEDYTVCDISLTDIYNNVERHKVNIKYSDLYSEDFKKITTDGTITINSTTIGDKNNLLWSFVNSIQIPNINVNFSNCNDDLTECDLSITNSNTNKSETHIVKFKYEEKYSEEFSKTVGTNKLVVNSIRPNNSEQSDFLIQNYLDSLSHGIYQYSIGTCNDDYSICDISLAIYDEENYYYNTSETHKMNITYSDLDTNKQTEVNKVLAKVPNNKTFIVEDLEVINYIVNSGYTNESLYDSAEVSFINFSTELKELLGNGNITATLQVRGGGMPVFVQENIGGYILSYDGVAYGLFHGGAEKRNVIYIPDETEDTQEAYIKAAQKRIDEYIGKNKIEITYSGKLSEIEESDHEELGYNLKDEFYTLSYKEYIFPFLIIKDSSKMQKISGLSTSDIMTNISISSNSSTLPLDTSVKVDEILEDSAKYAEITSKLTEKNYNTNNALIYDLKLYSYSNKDYITKLSNDTFEVKIPLTNELKGKTLVVYYVHDDGTVDEYDVNPSDNDDYAVFTTDHFSIYTIAEKENITNEDQNTDDEEQDSNDGNEGPTGSVQEPNNEKPELDEEVPNTYDGINNYIVLVIISLIGLVGSTVYLKKQKLN